MTTDIKVMGFKNLGNTCYMNSALQALLSSNIINNGLLMYIQRNPDSITKFSPMLIEYYRIIIDMLLEKKSNVCVYSPSLFRKVLHSENAWFRGTDHHDSHEMIVYMINEFADEKKEKGVANLIRKICFGKYKQYVWCIECKNVVESYFNFLDVVLPIPKMSSSSPDLEDCFNNFAKYDILDSQNKWKCPTCKKNVIAHKKMEIHEVPNVAIFTFNRFIGTVKNNTPIRIYEYIELDGQKLKLISTVNHYGGTNGGHYVAHVSRDNKWYCINDSHVNEISVDKLLNDPSIYMVIYQIDG